jgi:hypothetical protein
VKFYKSDMLRIAPSQETTIAYRNPMTAVAAGPATVTVLLLPSSLLEMLLSYLAYPKAPM